MPRALKVFKTHIGFHDLIVDDGTELMAVVRVTRGAVVSWLNDVAFRYDIEVTALHPFKRALSPVTVAPGAFTAAGTVPAEIEVTTTSSGTVHVEQGGLAIKAGTVPAGTVFTSGPGFTNLPRSVVGPSGEDLYSLTLPGTQWPAVVPGANSFLSLGTADVEITYYPTYA